MAVESPTQAADALLTKVPYPGDDVMSPAQQNRLGCNRQKGVFCEAVSKFVALSSTQRLCEVLALLMQYQPL
jgi:hypothetical protein